MAKQPAAEALIDPPPELVAALAKMTEGLREGEYFFQCSVRKDQGGVTLSAPILTEWLSRWGDDWMHAT